MKIVSAEQMREIDRRTIENGMAANLLMGFAGKAVFDFIKEKFNNMARDLHIALICGKGNNGGDGLVTAYFLSREYSNVKVFLMGERENLSPESQSFYDLCESRGVAILPMEEFSSDDNYTLIVDCLLGTGFKGDLRPDYQQLVDKINCSGGTILSVDIPSGLPASGPVSEDIRPVNAHMTITIGFPKINLLTYPGKKFTGELRVADIGFHPTDLKDIHSSVIDKEMLIQNLKINKTMDTYKNREGHLLVVGGFSTMEGAALLAARGAMETGVGLLSLVTEKECRNIIAGHVPEIMTEGIDKNLSIKDMEQYFQTIIDSKKINVILVGSGLGRSTTASNIVSALLNVTKGKEIPMVIDGDGLFHLGNLKDRGDFKPSDSLDRMVLTPHFGEASHLLKKSIEDIKADRFNSAIEIDKLYNCTVILKGPASIVASGEKVGVSTGGNPALATAGSGDVLAGICASLLLKNNDFISACGAAHLHGVAADLFVKEKNLNIMKASDIVNTIPHAMRDLFK